MHSKYSVLRIKKYINDLVGESVSEFVKQIFCIGIVFIIIRILEYCYVIIFTNYTVNIYNTIIYSVNFDTLLILVYSYFIFPIYLLLSIINKNISKWFIHISAFILIILNLILTNYFLATNNLLTAEIFSSSFEDLMITFITQFSWNKLPVWLLNLIIVFLSIIVFRKIKLAKDRVFIAGLVCVYFLSLIVVLLNISHYSKSVKYFDSEFEYCIGNSKISILIDSYITINKENNAYARTSIIGYKKSVANWQDCNSFSYKSDDYPLLHKNNYLNVLGKYFDSCNMKPNVVLIISESLSASFCGKTKIYHNLMPFTDSLIDKSLYWENFLSNAERSYGVIPSIIGSLPFGNSDRGFLATEDVHAKRRRYPQHLSLIHWLKQNHYKSYYFYGGWGYFDNVGYYLNEVGLDYLLDKSNIETSKYNNRTNYVKEKFSWGYNDKILFDHSLNVLDKHKETGPYFSIYFTLSLHDPFNIVDSEYRKDNFIISRCKSQNIDMSVRDMFGIELISSIMFVDDALKDFFYEYKKRPDFGRTIFIIVGDHGISLNSGNIFENYNVPLIIYSPLLTENRVFKGVSSQLDILPTLYSLLSDNYHLSKIEESNWLGHELDTSSEFKSTSIFHLSLKSLTVPSFVYRNYLISNNYVYSFNSFNEKLLVGNSDTVSHVLRLFEDYKIINYMSCKKDKIYK